MLSLLTRRNQRICELLQGQIVVVKICMCRTLYDIQRFYNDSAAVTEANYFIANAKRYANVQPGTLLILDAEIKGMPSSSVIALSVSVIDPSTLYPSKLSVCCQQST